MTKLQECRFTLFNDGEGGAFAGCLTHGDASRFKDTDLCWIAAEASIPEEAMAERQRRRREQYEEDANRAIRRIDWSLKDINMHLDTLDTDLSTPERRGVVEALRTMADQMEVVRKRL